MKERKEALMKIGLLHIREEGNGGVGRVGGAQNSLPRTSSLFLSFYEEKRTAIHHLVFNRFSGYRVPISSLYCKNRDEYLQIKNGFNDYIYRGY